MRGTSGTAEGEDWKAVFLLLVGQYICGVRREGPEVQGEHLVDVRQMHF
jgi:hypothetical protein